MLTAKSSISITNAAWKKIINIANAKNAKGFIFSAVSGGCNGLNYKLNLFKNQDEIDKLKNGTIKPSKIYKNNVSVYVDPLSEMFLLGTEIDYITEDFDKGIFENKFVFIPDKDKATTCGCGISFSPKKID